MGSAAKTVSERAVRRVIAMIFVTVGNHNQPFTRLFRELDQLVSDRKLTERIVCQTGYTDFTFHSDVFESRAFFTMAEFHSLVSISDVYITHAGHGSILNGLKHLKKPVVVPRLKRWAEHTNDHQLDIVRELAKDNLIIPVFDVNDLAEAVELARQSHGSGIATGTDKIIKIIETFIDRDIRKM